MRTRRGRLSAPFSSDDWVQVLVQTHAFTCFLRASLKPKLIYGDCVAFLAIIPSPIETSQLFVFRQKQVYLGLESSLVCFTKLMRNE